MSAGEPSNSQWYVEDNPRWPYDKYVRTYFVKPLHYKCLVVIALRFSTLVMFTTRPHFERDDGL